MRHHRRHGRYHRLRRELRFYYGRHLHRRLFFWFGAVILMTVVSIGLVTHFTGQRGRRPPLPILFGVPALMLWTASGRIARRIARPLYEVTRVAKQIGAGDLKARTRPDDCGIDEVSILAAAVNDMAARIEKQLADQRELLAGVSHELRTPLGHLRVLLETAREQGSSETTFGSMEREIVEIDALVGELLASARLDFQAIERVSVDPVESARRALERAGLPADLLADETDGGLRAQADPTLLARALANLVDNAQKHGRGLTCLRVRASANVIAFDAEDAGPGFPTGPRPTPSGPRPEGSLGLGLSLVGRIARAHGGRVVSANRDGAPGARVTLELPA